MSDVEARLASLEVNMRQAQARIRVLEKDNDILAKRSPLLKQLLWIIDGWPVFHYRQFPKWRPWRRWYRS